MGRLYISAVNQVPGPWLLSHENLESLDDLFNAIDYKLKKALTKTIESTARQQMEEEVQILDLSKRISKLQRKYDNKFKSAVITFTDGSTFEANDIKEILDHVNSHSTQSPVELYIRTMHGNHENEFSLIIISNPDKEEPDFEYQIKCLDYDIQLEIKTLIDKWIRENKPSQLLQIWGKVIVFIWIAGFLGILISYNNLSYTVSKIESYKTELKQEAQRIIEHKTLSITDSSILLLLKLQSDYLPEKIKSATEIVYDKSAKKNLIVSLIIFVVSLFPPRTTIGIGRKFNWYKFYQFWWKYIICGGISLLLTTFLADSFLHFIQW